MIAEGKEGVYLKLDSLPRDTLQHLLPKKRVLGTGVAEGVTYKKFLFFSSRE